MSEAVMIFLLSICVVLLACTVVYQQVTFRAGIQNTLNEISQTLEVILDTDSDEKVMVFTDHKSLISLMMQINRLLADRQKVRADYRRSEIASKRMLSNISHDIKTPMTVILGYLEIMRVNGDPRQEMLGKVEATAHRVMELITQFFTLAKLEAGDTKLEGSKLNLNEACRENILGFYELLSNREFQIEIDIPKEPIFVMGDPDALHRILFNLISNAIRYGADGKYLGMVLRADQSNAYIDIIDRGRGIPKEFADTIFDRLFTMEDSRNPRMQGNGLGLTIAKNLALQLGGDVALKSQPNVKTVFTVTFKKLTD